MQLIRLGVGGLSGGIGIAGYKSWVIALVILLVLAGLARWAVHPARRESRAQRRKRGTQDPDHAT